jgi:hypothetical protein
VVPVRKPERCRRYAAPGGSKSAVLMARELPTDQKRMPTTTTRTPPPGVWSLRAVLVG